MKTWTVLANGRIDNPFKYCLQTHEIYNYNKNRG